MEEEKLEEWVDMEEKEKPIYNNKKIYISLHFHYFIFFFFCAFIMIFFHIFIVWPILMDRRKGFDGVIDSFH